MYRKSLEMEENNVAIKESCDFLTRVTGLPVFQSVMVSTLGVYNKAKEGNGIVKYTLNTAEKTVSVAAEKAKPVIVKLETPIVIANNLACMTLDKLEEKMPIIKRTPEEIAAETKKMYDTTIVQPTLVRINSAKLYSLQKVNAVKDYGVSKATLLLDTKYGHILTGTLDNMLIKADGYMDAYIPVAKLEGQPDEPKMDVDTTPVHKALVLSTKLRQRMICHGFIKIQAAKKRTDEILSNLHLTFNLMDMAKSNFDSTNKALMERYTKAQTVVLKLWEDFNKGNPNIPGDKTLEQKLLFVATQLTTQLHNTYKKMASTLALLPSHVQPTVAAVQHYITNLYTQFANAKSWDDVSGVIVLQMRDGTKNLQLLYSQLYDNALNSRALSWLVKANHDERKVVRNGSVVGNNASITPVPSDDSPAESEGSQGEEQPSYHKTNDNSIPMQNCYKHDPHSSSDQSD